MNYDVAVVGGGFAGVAASLAAARTGAETLMLEKKSVPGGNVTQAFVHTICGLFALNAEEPEYLHSGLPEVFSQQLIREGFASEPESVGKVFVQPIFPETLGPHLQSRLRANSLIDCEYDTAVRGVSVDEGGVQLTVKYAGDSEPTRRRAANVIDASGDAVTGEGERSGGEPLQLPSLIFRVAGMAESLTSGYGKLRLNRAVASGVKEGDLPEGCESILVRPGKESGQAYITLNLPREINGGYDPFDSGALADYEEEARRRARLVVEYLRTNHEKLPDLEIDRFPERIGIRETRRVNTRYTMTEEDVLTGRSFEGAVTQSAWPIELWHEYTDAEFEYPEGPVDVPLDALVAERSPRLGVAGRCLGATHRAAGSLRVLGTALATGQALGVAAGVAAESNRPLGAVESNAVKSRIRDLDWDEVF